MRSNSLPVYMFSLLPSLAISHGCLASFDQCLFIWFLDFVFAYYCLSVHRLPLSCPDIDLSLTIWYFCLVLINSEQHLYSVCVHPWTWHIHTTSVVRLHFSLYSHFIFYFFLLHHFNVCFAVVKQLYKLCNRKNLNSILMYYIQCIIHYILYISSTLTVCWICVNMSLKCRHTHQLYMCLHSTYLSSSA